MGGSEMPLFWAADGAGREARPLPVSWAFLFVLPFGEAVCTRKKVQSSIHTMPQLISFGITKVISFPKFVLRFWYVNGRA